LNKDLYKNILWNREHSKALSGASSNIELRLGDSKDSDVTPHTHYIELSNAELIEIKGGKEIYKETSMRSGHTHSLRVRWNAEEKHFFYFRCDKDYRCWDGHPKILINVEN